MNDSLKEYPGISFKLNIALNQLLVRFNEQMIYIQNVSARATWWSPSGNQVKIYKRAYWTIEYPLRGRPLKVY